MDDDDLSEIEARLDILRQRAKAYEDFVSPPGQPPLLWQMAMLADAGFTILPRVDHPDPDRSFPETTVEMRELNWGPRHRCLIGGERFDVMSVPESYHGHLLKPKVTTPRYFVSDEPPEPVISFEQEHYRVERYALTHRGKVRWLAEIMVCQGSPAARYLAANRGTGRCT